jgi:hypothetical protein
MPTLSRGVAHFADSLVRAFRKRAMSRVFRRIALELLEQEA